MLKYSCVLATALCLGLAACGDSGSSSDPAPAPTAPASGGDNATPAGGSSVGTAATGNGSTASTGTGTPTTSGDGTASSGSSGGTVIPVTPVPGTPSGSGSAEAALSLSGVSQTYKLMQFDCGDIAAPIGNDQVLPKLNGFSEFVSLGVTTTPTERIALLTSKITDGAASCDYRVQFNVRVPYTQAFFGLGQALDAASVPACGSSKASLDAAIAAAPIKVEYERWFRWVGLHLPANIQTSAVCPAGNLRVVFASDALL